MDAHDSAAGAATKQPPTHIYVLSYLRPLPDGGLAGADIGYYTTVSMVEAAKARLRDRPGFRDYPEGFSVNCYRIDEDYDDPTFFTLWDRPKSE
jgi:hypothetical protein